jgi:hypothetical protein
MRSRHHDPRFEMFLRAYLNKVWINKATEPIATADWFAKRLLGQSVKAMGARHLLQAYGTYMHSANGFKTVSERWCDITDGYKFWRDETDVQVVDKELQQALWI